MALSLSLPIDPWVVRAVVATLLVVVASVWLAVRTWRRSRPMRITALYIHPVKSCRGIRLESVECTRLGPRYDRQWMVVDAETGVMTTAREHPRMVLITPSIDEANQTLTLSYRDRKPITVTIAPPTEEQEVLVWDDPLPARRYSEEVSTWLTEVITPSDEMRSPNAKRKRFNLVTIVSTKTHQREVSKKHDWNDASQDVQAGAFGDGYPLLMTSEASLAKLNTWTRPTRDVEMISFRPNVCISGGTLEPWAEDYWRSIQFGSDPANRFTVAKPCERCILTTVVPSTGELHPSGEPLMSLRKHRSILSHLPQYTAASSFFGQNLVQCSPSIRLSVGDLVTVLDRKESVFEYSPQYLREKAAAAAVAPDQE